MAYKADDRVKLAKMVSVHQIVERLGIVGLRQSSRELIGPCPSCGGTDRFSININMQVFNCRGCGIKGGDMIGLVMSLEHIDFKGALDWIIGADVKNISPEEQAKRSKDAEAYAKKREADQKKFRADAIRAAKNIWLNTKYLPDGDVRQYLLKRGFSRALLPELPKCLHTALNHVYTHQSGGKYHELHKGAAMVAAIQNADGIGSAVHQTWIDLDQSNGKASISFEGAAFPSKKMRGSKKGGAIHLHNPLGADTLVVGEGIETTLAALVSRAMPEAAHWACGDLGNMAGRMLKLDGARYSGEPDMTDKDAFVPPDWVKNLVFIMDGDSDPIKTEALIKCGLRRAAQIRGIECKMVRADSGVDLNDMLVGV